MTGQAEDRFWHSGVRCPTKQCFFARHLPIGTFFWDFADFQNHSEPAQHKMRQILGTFCQKSKLWGSCTVNFRHFSENSPEMVIPGSHRPLNLHFFFKILRNYALFFGKSSKISRTGSHSTPEFQTPLKKGHFLALSDQFWPPILTNLLLIWGSLFMSILGTF